MIHQKMISFTGLVSVALLLVAVCSGPPVPVSAQAETQGGFTEEFNSLPGDGWEHTPDVTVTDGALMLYGGNFLMKLGVWGDQQTTIRFRRNTAEGEFIIHYFASDRGSYNLNLSPDRVVLEKSSGPDNTLSLGDAAYQPVLQTWTDLSITVENGNHTITLDGETVLTATDPDPIVPGAIGFNYFGPESVEIDSMSLTPAGGAEPAPEGQVDQPVAVQPTAAATAAVTSANLFDSIQTLFNTQGTQVDLLTFTINLLLSVVLAFILGRVYIYWGGSLSNRRKFAANFMLMTVTTTFIILVVRSSVALSLGLVGALSIVRFRTAVKEPEELAYLFFAISIGIGLGDNQRLVTIVAFAIAILIVGLLKLFRHREADVNLHLTVASHNPQKLSLEQVMAALKPHTAKLKLLRLDETDQTLETAFLVEFKHVDDLNAAKAAVQALSPQASITFLDNKGIW